MVEFKLTIADPKSGKCVQKTVTDQAAESLVGLKIGETVKGETLDLTGYEFLITGGSDFCGFPMRKGISGARKRILIGKSIGFRGKKGIRTRKTVCGEAIHDQVVQINLKIMKKGKKAIVAEKKEAKEEAPKEEKPKEEKKEEKPKEEAKPEEKKEEKTKEEAPKQEANK